MPAFRSTESPDPRRVCAAWSELFPTLMPLEFTPDPDDPNGTSVIQFKHGDAFVLFAFIPAPIPAPDIEAACAQSWMWKDAAAQMTSHVAHAIVTTVPAGASVNEAMLVSRVIASVAKVAPTAGVYWGSAGQVHNPALFADALNSFSDGNLPVMLWVGVRVSRDSSTNRSTLSTEGLRAFGHLELEAIETSMTPGDLRMTAMEVANYLLENGPVLKHGHTFGGDDSERIRIEHVGSRFRKGERVMKLCLP
ncbi:MAG: DUF4261 domain-containing protein [Phycisphaerae bacterium]|nr:DUF4261 domain-containing protein [Phycisphaerae bacterium]